MWADVSSHGHLERSPQSTALGLRTFLFHSENKDPLSVMRASKPKDDLSWNESSSHSQLWGTHQGSAKEMAWKTGLQEQGSVGGT